MERSLNSTRNHLANPTSALVQHQQLWDLCIFIHFWTTPLRNFLNIFDQSWWLLSKTVGSNQCIIVHGYIWSSRTRLYLVARGLPLSTEQHDSLTGSTRFTFSIWSDQNLRETKKSGSLLDSLLSLSCSLMLPSVMMWHYKEFVCVSVDQDWNLMQTVKLFLCKCFRNGFLRCGSTQTNQMGWTPCATFTVNQASGLRSPSFNQHLTPNCHHTCFTDQTAVIIESLTSYYADCFV